MTNANRQCDKRSIATPRCPTRLVQVVKRKFRRGEILEGQVTRGTIVDAIARQRKVQIVPEMIEMSAPILRHGIYDIPLGIRMPDGQPVMLEVIVRTP